jgi:hypothetical protein
MNPQWQRKEKSESEQLFDRLLFYRQLANLLVERLRITKELEHLLPEDQTKFTEYLSDIICQYEKECEVVHDVEEDDPVPEGFKDVYYDENTKLVQYLYSKRMLILSYLQELKTLWNKERVEEVTVKIKEAHDKDVSEISNAKKIIENNFPLLEMLTFTATSKSIDIQKNEKLEKSLEEMRNDFRNNGFNV